jgi:hypothetical protein
LKQVKAELQSLDSDTNDAELQKVQTKVDEAQLARDKACATSVSSWEKLTTQKLLKILQIMTWQKPNLKMCKENGIGLKDGQNKDDILAAQAKVTAANLSLGWQI